MSKPNPGSDAALKMGCLCPIMDNGHGNEELGRIRGFYVNHSCPVHAQRGCDKCGDSAGLEEIDE